MTCSCPFWGNYHPQLHYCRKHQHAACPDAGQFALKCEGETLLYCEFCLTLIVGKERARVIMDRAKEEVIVI